jgi:tetratricopeptide (TPR) repeat protein
LILRFLAGDLFMQAHQKSTVPPTLNPERFSFWMASAERCLSAGGDRPEIPLPEILLPVNLADLEDGEPSDAAIGQGIYDYLRQFPDCPHNKVYAELLQEAFPHFLADLASQAVLLDAKHVETVHIRRKLTGLKILALVEKDNAGLLLQLCRGFYDLALSFEELGSCRRHLLQAMRYGQELLKVSPENPYALNMLAEIDIMFGDFPGADDKWQRILDNSDDQPFKDRISSRKRQYVGRPWLENTLVDDLESVGKALELYASEQYPLALAILDRIEEIGLLPHDLPSADYFYLLGMCRRKNGLDLEARKALQRSLELDPEHAAAQDALAEYLE